MARKSVLGSQATLSLRDTRSIENAHKNPAEIDKWIQSINDLHRTKPPPQVNDFSTTCSACVFKRERTERLPTLHYRVMHSLVFFFA